MPVSKQQRDEAMIRIMDPLIEHDEKTNDFSMIATYFEEQDAREREIARLQIALAQAEDREAKVVKDHDAIHLAWLKAIEELGYAKRDTDRILNVLDLSTRDDVIDHLAAQSVKDAE